MIPDPILKTNDDDWGELNNLRISFGTKFGIQIKDTLDYYNIHNREHYKPFYRRGKIGRIFNLVRRNMR